MRSTYGRPFSERERASRTGCGVCWAAGSGASDSRASGAAAARLEDGKAGARGSAAESAASRGWTMADTDARHVAIGTRFKTHRPRSTHAPESLLGAESNFVGTRTEPSHPPARLMKT